MIPLTDFGNYIVGYLEFWEYSFWIGTLWVVAGFWYLKRVIMD